MKQFLLQSFTIKYNALWFMMNFWFWIAIIEFLVILILFKKISVKKQRFYDTFNLAKISNSRSVKIDMDDLLNNINKSNKLYKELSIKFHPDRFRDHKMVKKANDILKEISINKRNYKKLLELKEIAERELK